MARPNKRVRAKLKAQGQVQLVADLRNEHDDSRKLQQGRVNCALERSATVYSLIMPRPLWEPDQLKGTPTRRQQRAAIMPDLSKTPREALAILGTTGVSDPRSPRAPVDDDNIRRRVAKV